MNTRYNLTFILVMLAAAALWQLGIAGWIHTKAIAAQILLDRAWQQTLIDHDQTRPWPWADTWPVAELIVPELDISHIVLLVTVVQHSRLHPAIHLPAPCLMNMAP